MSGLKVVALISGGKDSLFSIIHCMANGHEVVALANLHPPLEDDSPEDMDSYMYQTIGHAVIPLYEQTLQLPLHRRAITGKAVNQDKSYCSPLESAEEPDETEDLLSLLRGVVAAHPEVKAVSTGAILSDYQRTRVESVALRLGLIPLSFLWQYPFLPPYNETSLLEDMTAVGLDARIIKVASGGLDDSFLWANVAEQRTQRRLIQAMSRFGVLGAGAVLGEGGEFETLAIDGPAPLWKKHIEVTEDERAVVAGEAGTASVHIKQATLLPKDGDPVAPEAALSRLRIPPLLDDGFAAIADSVNHMSSRRILEEESRPERRQLREPVGFPTWQRQDRAASTSISNAVCPGEDAGIQMTAIMDRLVNEERVSPNDMVSSTILLRSMADFAAINTAYGSHFSAPNPPARITISCGDMLPAGAQVSLSVHATKRIPDDRIRGLHVQSRSYWAPANIGPYSQAISVPTSESEGVTASIVFIAGQIPLVPASMALPPITGADWQSDIRMQTVLSLQHLWRIGQVMDVRSWLGAVAFLSRMGDETMAYRANAAFHAWSQAHSASVETEDGDDDEEQDVVDIWDVTHGRQTAQQFPTLCRRPDITCTFEPPSFVAQVDELPRGASIEWASIGYSFQGGRLGMTETKSEHGRRWNLHRTNAATVLEDVAGWIACYDTQTLEQELKNIGITGTHGDRVFTVYTSVAMPLAWLEETKARVIPCQVWDNCGRHVVALISWISVSHGAGSL